MVSAVLLNGLDKGQHIGQRDFGFKHVSRRQEQSAHFVRDVNPPLDQRPGFFGCPGVEVCAYMYGLTPFPKVFLWT